jgi:hypothetical protein
MEADSSVFQSHGMVTDYDPSEAKAPHFPVFFGQAKTVPLLQK